LQQYETGAATPNVMGGQPKHATQTQHASVEWGKRRGWLP